MSVNGRPLHARIQSFKFRHRIWWPIIAGISAMCLVFAMGIAGYMLIEGWGFVDSAYMVVITLSTVGYTEVNPLSEQGRIFTATLILCGVGGFAYLVGSFTQLLVEGRVQLLLGRRRM